MEQSYLGAYRASPTRSGAGVRRQLQSPARIGGQVYMNLGQSAMGDNSLDSAPSDMPRSVAPSNQNRRYSREHHQVTPPPTCRVALVQPYLAILPYRHTKVHFASTLRSR